jgi:hypothetical protein
MKTYEFEIVEKSYDCGGDYVENSLPIKIQVVEMTTEEGQPGLVVILDGYEDERKIGCALLHPCEEHNYFRGIRYALNRTVFDMNVAYQIFVGFCRAWGKDTLESEFSDDPFGVTSKYFKMVFEIIEFKKELDE